MAIRQFLLVTRDGSNLTGRLLNECFSVSSGISSKPISLNVNEIYAIYFLFMGGQLDFIQFVGEGSIKGKVLESQIVIETAATGEVAVDVDRIASLTYFREI